MTHSMNWTDTDKEDNFTGIIIIDRVSQQSYLYVFFVTTGPGHIQQTEINGGVERVIQN